MTSDRDSRQRRFAQFAWGVLAYNILVIVWGAYVRASLSGDGCGDHWPTCNGGVLLHAPAAKTIIEFLHRVMTGFDTPALIALWIWAFRVFPRKHPVRLFAVLSVVFLVIEALLGAGLVLFKYVAQDASMGRAIYLSAHLTNTMLLLSVLSITAWLADKGIDRLRFANLSGLLKGALPVTLLVCITGGIAALGDTLFPATSLSSSMQQDFSATSSVLLRLRVFHPVVAILGGIYLLTIVTSVLKGHPNGGARKAATRVLYVTLFQLGVGALNISLLAPVWMQLFHLFMADVLWISVLLMVLETVPSDRPVPISSFVPARVE